MCLGGPGPGGGSPGVGGSIPGGIGLGIGGGGMAASTGSGVPGAGEGYGGLGNVPTGLAPGNEPQSSDWGSSDYGQLASLVMTGLSMAVPGLAPLAAASIVPDFFGVLPDMDISRPIPAQTPEDVISQSGTTGQPSPLPSISTPAPAPVEAAPPAVDNTAFNKELMDQYMSTILSAPPSGNRGIRGAGRPGYKAQQKQTADDWLAKYWKE